MDKYKQRPAQPFDVPYENPIMKHFLVLYNGQNADIGIAS